MLEFQEQELKHNLDLLGPRSRAAFATSCAQRLAEIYHAFLRQSGRDDRAAVCDSALNYVWTHILASSDVATTEQLLAEVMPLIPDQDAPGWTPLTAYAEDALSALAYCLSCLHDGDTQEATWAARCVYEALDYFVTIRDDVSPEDPGAELRVLADPAVQAELERQTRDLAELSSAGNSLSPELLDRLRRRSAAEQAIHLD